MSMACRRDQGWPDYHELLTVKIRGDQYCMTRFRQNFENYSRRRPDEFRMAASV